jgi:hypothetical protein
MNDSPSDTPNTSASSSPARQGRIVWTMKSNGYTGYGQWLSARDAEKLCELVRNSAEFVYSVEYREGVAP